MSEESVAEFAAHAHDAPRPLADRVDAVVRNLEAFAGKGHTRNPKVIASLVPPAMRGLVLRNGKDPDHTDIKAQHRARFNWTYARDRPQIGKLYKAAKKGQWDADDLAWDTDVDPMNPEVPIIHEQMTPLYEIPAYQRLDSKEKARHRAGVLAWFLSQFLHGEQGALFAACQVTEAVDWYEGKLYGSTQVVDEGRHCEVFERYLHEKLEQSYTINDNLFVVLDSLVSDSRWDVKFLGMQILVEGLALGAFGTLRKNTGEPLLRELLGQVITDEARHVHFGVVALQDCIANQLSDAERRERQDWAYEMCLLLRNRFLAHEFYDEYYGHLMTRRQWDKAILESRYMADFRQTMFRRIVPNLKRIGLLPDRLKPHYAELGLMDYADLPAAPELTAEDLLA